MTTEHFRHRRTFLQCAASTALLATAGRRALAATTAAVDNLRMVVGFPAGSAIDVTARPVASRLSLDGFARSAYVDNRTGAGGQLAIAALREDQSNDGRTLLLTPMAILGIYPHTYRTLPYDPVTDLQPVTQAVSIDFALAVGPAVPPAIRSVGDFLTWAKADKKRTAFASPAAGGQPHFVGVMLGRQAGVEMNHVPYRGSPPALQDVLGGQIPAAIVVVGDAMRFAGRPGYRILATTGATRSRFAPEVPTLVESGFKDLVFSEWFGFFMPRNPLPAALEATNLALRKAIDHPETVAAFAQSGMQAMTSTPAELAALLQRDTARWGPIVKSVGFTAES